MFDIAAVCAFCVITTLFQQNVFVQVFLHKSTYQYATLCAFVQWTFQRNFSYCVSERLNFILYKQKKAIIMC